jgi:misacylated tRNA(Ala) deacylase
MEAILNEPKKLYNEPMHTCEHILNQTMIRIFGCPRSMNAHIEKRKSKCDYILEKAPSEKQITELIQKVNEVIDRHLPVTIDFTKRTEAGKLFDLSKLPLDASETLRIVRIGDYDACACIGQHVENTSDLGHFEIISHDFENGRWRVRFRLA